MAGTSQHPSTMDAARRRSARSHRWRSYLPALPFIAVVACYELMPLLRLAADSFVGKESGALSLENYITVLTAPLYQRSIMNSVVIGLVSAAVGIVVAFLAARFCSEASPRVRRAFTMVLNMMSNFSGVPLAFAFISWFL